MEVRKKKLKNISKSQLRRNSDSRCISCLAPFLFLFLASFFHLPHFLSHRIQKQATYIKSNYIIYLLCTNVFTCQSLKQNPPSKCYTKFFQQDNDRNEHIQKLVQQLDKLMFLEFNNKKGGLVFWVSYFNFIVLLFYIYILQKYPSETDWKF